MTEGSGNPERTASVRNYLKAYNILLCIGWSIVLFLSLISGFEISRSLLLFLAICQFAALLEIAHSALGWVRSPIVNTAIQVASRVFITLLLFVIPGEKLLGVGIINGLTMIIVAWSLTEIIRYAYYFFTLAEKPAKIIEYLRYTLFIGLYPLGVCGELLIIFSVICWQGIASWAGIFMLLILPGYLIFFPRLYRYMWQQRKKKLRSQT